MAGLPALIAAKKSPEEMVDELYLAAFGRLPEPDRIGRRGRLHCGVQGPQSWPGRLDVGDAQQQGIFVQPLSAYCAALSDS